VNDFEAFFEFALTGHSDFGDEVKEPKEIPRQKFEEVRSDADKFKPPCDSHGNY